MALENKREQHDQQVVDKYHNPNADYTMTTYDYILRPSATTGSGDIVITLPPVNEAKGRFYSIVPRACSSSNTITIQDQDDSEGWADQVIEATTETLLLYSDGYYWHRIATTNYSST